MATPIPLKPDEWKVGLVEISYHKESKKPFILNTPRVDSEEISFHVKHYESVYDLPTSTIILGTVYEKINLSVHQQI